MAPPLRPPVVRVVAAGAALSLAATGCKKEPEVTGNPPPPTLPEEPSPVPQEERPTSNPPAPSSDLPTWESVASNHPKGATNPPMPVLAVTEDGAHCYKEWRGGMIPPDPEVLAVGGRVLTEGQASDGTEVQCPPHAEKVLQAHASRKAKE